MTRTQTRSQNHLPRSSTSQLVAHPSETLPMSLPTPGVSKPRVVIEVAEADVVAGSLEAKMVCNLYEASSAH